MKIEDLPKSEYNGVRVITNTDACKFIGCGHDYLLVYTRRERSHIKLEPSEVLFRREGFARRLGISCRKYVNTFQQLIDTYFDNNLIEDTPAPLPAEIKSLTPVNYSNEIVLTTAQVSEFYGCSPDNIKKNFNANIDKFEEGKHFFKLEGEELKNLQGKNVHLQISSKARTMYLWTKRGCARHSKMLGTDTAWEVFEELEENYFKQKNFVEVSSSPTKMSDIAQEVTAAAKIYEDYFGLQRGMAFIHTIAQAETIYGIDLSPTKRLAPPAEHETGYLNATQVGEKVGKSAREVNLFLEEKGLQFKDGKDWRLTKKGEDFGEYYPYTNNGHSGYQIRFNPKILTLFNVINLDSRS